MRFFDSIGPRTGSTLDTLLICAAESCPLPQNAFLTRGGDVSLDFVEDETRAKQLLQDAVCTPLQLLPEYQRSSSPCSALASHAFRVRFFLALLEYLGQAELDNAVNATNPAISDKKF